MHDLEYINTGLFTRFFPCSPAGEDAWRVMEGSNHGSAVLTIHAKAVIAQLNRAGYRVRKAKKSSMSIDDILNELL